jgi:hypothetical protein
LLTKKIGGIMGTQQILLIVLSVVVVGIAVAVGITMFNNQAVNSNRQAVISDLQNLGAQVMAWYRMPASMGGGGQTVPTSGELGESGLLDYIGFSAASNGYSTENGTYSISADGDAITIIGVGTETANAGGSAVQATLVITPDSESPLQTTINY